MKTSRAISLVCAVAFLVAAGGRGASAENAADIFGRALYLERGVGDPAAANGLYERVVDDPVAGAELAAQACWRSGLCLERLGRRTDAAARHLHLLSTAEPASAPREAAARALLRLADEAGPDEAEAAAAWLAAVQAGFPGLAARLAGERGALRRTLRGVVQTWDGQAPKLAAVRIRARATAPGAVEGRSIWRTQTDPAGRFAMELPIGAYEIRIGAPAYERVYLTAVLVPEEAAPPEIQCVLPRIPLPAHVDRVAVVGSFLDDWEGDLPLASVGAGRWEVRHRLGPGVHDYKFRLNGETHLVTDVRAAAFVSDSHEGFNARLELDQEQDVEFRFDENDPHFRRTDAARMDDD